MTRTEAANMIKNDIHLHHDYLSGEYRKALKMAISALEQPEIICCKDCKFAEVADKEDGQDGYTCQFHRGSIWFSGSYCSWAERREE